MVSSCTYRRFSSAKDHALVRRGDRKDQPYYVTEGRRTGTLLAFKDGTFYPACAESDLRCLLWVPGSAKDHALVRRGDRKDQPYYVTEGRRTGTLLAFKDGTFYPACTEIQENQRPE